MFELCLHFLFTELTHEFLQILEKTPSRLKRIRNWRVRCIFVLDFLAMSDAVTAINVQCTGLDKVMWKV